MAKLILMLVFLCLLLIPQLSYGDQEGYVGAKLGNRKVVLSGMEMKKVIVDKAEEKPKEAAELGRELREAPMGPDPLHHSGAPPRKVVSGVEMKKLFVDKAAGKHEEKQKLVAEMGRELREAPMGPDPLHHNGAPPRKPRTTP